MIALNKISDNILKNISRFLEIDNNIVFNIKVVDKKEKTIKDNNYLFGYEINEREDEYNIFYTKGLILFKPNLKFLRSIGVVYDSDLGGGGELPITAFFKEQDKIRIKNEIYVLNKYKKDNEEFEIERGFIVTDIKQIHFAYTFLNTYFLAPLR